MLAKTEAAWPLPTPKAESWYNAFVAAIENGKFDGCFADEDATDDPTYDLNWAKGQGNGYSSMVHELEINRVNLRKFVRATGRRIPKWLRKKYDSD